ncbi:acyl-CoA carboxylase epsilon subunit-like protein [Kineococcus xinjiangensis]|uniref:Acyl-CoA carboxylase epsilon subunit-like protein n=1 Tax=Kineococcus xinjiangensis TaxID=512762 RepID=A0A2S6IU55_9ACTN|nr:acyl-CoA carboxylase epsilon subunit-like protein [Kineococcus xinjiangensis]
MRQLPFQGPDRRRAPLESGTVRDGAVAESALRIVRGTLDEEELAALTAVVGALARTRARSGPRPQPLVTSAWTDRAHQLLRGQYKGIDGWRRSGLPR